MSFPSGPVVVLMRGLASGPSTACSFVPAFRGEPELSGVSAVSGGPQMEEPRSVLEPFVGLGAVGVDPVDDLFGESA